MIRNLRIRTHRMYGRKNSALLCATLTHLAVQMISIITGITISFATCSRKSRKKHSRVHALQLVVTMATNRNVIFSYFWRYSHVLHGTAHNALRAMVHTGSCYASWLSLVPHSCRARWWKTCSLFHLFPCTVGVEIFVRVNFRFFFMKLAFSLHYFPFLGPSGPIRTCRMSTESLILKYLVRES